MTYRHVIHPNLADSSNTDDIMSREEDDHGTWRHHLAVRSGSSNAHSGSLDEMRPMISHPRSSASSADRSGTPWCNSSGSSARWISSSERLRSHTWIRSAASLRRSTVTRILAV